MCVLPVLDKYEGEHHLADRVVFGRPSLLLLLIPGDADIWEGDVK